jgi:exoribonuclease R
LHTRSITLRGINVESWTTDTSPRRRASDINTAMAVATLLTNQFDTAATYPLTALEDAIAHASSPETVGTVLVQP